MTQRRMITGIGRGAYGGGQSPAPAPAPGPAPEPTPEPEPTPTPEPDPVNPTNPDPAPSDNYYYNIGGPTVTSSDGYTYVSDAGTGVVSNGTAYTESTTSVVGSNFDSTGRREMLTARYGTQKSLVVSVPQTGRRRIVFLMTEYTFNGTGQRVFTAHQPGSNRYYASMLDVDLFAIAGLGGIVTKEIVVDGPVDIELRSSVDNPIVSAIANLVAEPATPLTPVETVVHPPRLLISPNPDRSGASVLNGQSVLGKQAIFVNGDEIASVTFRFGTNAPRTDDVHPYDLLGGTDTAAEMLDVDALSVGTYTVNAEVVRTDASTTAITGSFNKPSTGESFTASHLRFGTQRASCSDWFVGSISHTMHFNYVSIDEVKNIHWPAFRDLGARMWRDGGPDNATWHEKVRIMTQNGARGIVTMDPRDGNGPGNVVRYMKNLQRVSGRSDVIWLVEGPNEWDLRKSASATYDGKTVSPFWGQNLRDYQKGFYDALKADPATRHIFVAAPSLAHPGDDSGRATNAAELGQVACDWLTGHWYQGGNIPDNQWGDDISTDAAWTGHKWSTIKEQGKGRNLPIYVSETGWHLEGTLAGQPGITMNAAKRYVPRLYCEAWWRSVRWGRPLIASEYNISRDRWSVLLDGNGNRTPAWYAHRAMIGLLEERSTPEFTPVPFQGTISAPASDFKYFVLNKSNGDHAVVMWRDAKSCNQGLRTDIVVSPTTVSFSLPAARNGIIYRPCTANNNGVATNQGTVSGTSFTVGVADEVVILMLAKPA